MLTDKQVEDARERINVKIHDLRKQIRQDMKDYELLNIVEDYFPIGSKSNFLFRYLESQINNNTLKLKELMEEKND